MYHHGTQKAVRIWKGQQRHAIVTTDGSLGDVMRTVLRRRFVVASWPSSLWVLVLCWVGCGFWTHAGHCAERVRPIHIGALTDSWGPTSTIVGFRDGLVSLGYREPEDFVLGVRFTQGDRTALAVAASQIIEAGADLVFADSNSTAKAAQHATTHLPIVFASVEDPVGSGLVQSFAKPGGNITGVATRDIALAPKRLQVFHELVPTLTRVLFLYDVHDVYSAAAARLYAQAAQRLGTELIVHTVHTQAEAQMRLSQVQQDNIQGIIAPRCCGLDIAYTILEAANQQQIPTMFLTSDFWIERGALASFGLSFYDTGRRAARLVDKILKGVHPAKIPVEVNAKIEFTINVKTANALGLRIAPEVLYQADHVVR